MHKISEDWIPPRTRETNTLRCLICVWDIVMWTFISPSETFTGTSYYLDLDMQRLRSAIRINIMNDSPK